MIRLLRVTHVISGLGVRGAETTLSRPLPVLRQFDNGHEVVSLTSIGPLGARLRSDGIDVESLGIENGEPQYAALYERVIDGRSRVGH